MLIDNCWESTRAAKLKKGEVQYLSMRCELFLYNVRGS